jgi:multiple PDZ domain protein
VLPAAKFLNETARLAVNEAAQGRDIKYIKLYKPEGSSLGFSVVGLKSAHKGELGIYVQEIQPQGIAGKDGRLLEGDQVRALPKSSSDETAHIYRIQPLANRGQL